MRTIAIKSAVAAAGAVLLLASSSSASVPMSGDDSEGAVSIYVKGKGLHVDSIDVISTKQRNGEAFRVYRHTGSEATSSYVTKWKKAKFVSAGMTKFSTASWKIKQEVPARDVAVRGLQGVLRQPLDQGPPLT